jgi:putative ABC transport system permease protein
MIEFLLKGLLRDRSRSLFPLLIVAAGVTLTVFLHAWLNGVISDLIRSTAHYRTGHVCVMTRAYADKADQIPNDLALLGIDTLLAMLRQSYPDFFWTPRITFGGLLDIPDDLGETKEQAPVSGMGVSLLSAASPEWRILNIRPALVRGRLPEKTGEILIAEELAEKLKVQPGQKATLISSTMYGSLMFSNFVIAGTVRFGLGPMDRGSIIVDLTDVQQALDMQQGAGVVLGLFHDDLYHEDRANIVTANFNARHTSDTDKFSPIMRTLRTQSGLSDYLDYVGVFSTLILAIFLLAMSIVLWNAGLTGGLRRYGEIGLRLAIGEETGHVYRSMMVESLMIGIAGSLLGTGIGVGCAYYLQVHGFDIGFMTRNSTMMLADVVRTQVAPLSFVVGFIPGILATSLGAAISGFGIYRRPTSQLFKELET